MDGLVERLRQRKLVQWALAYGAGAFALLQGVDIVAQRFGWPEAIERGLIVALAVGFFATLVVAWYHGERGAQRVSGTELAILALLLAIGGGLLWHAAQAPHEGTASTQAASAAGVALPASVSDKSIAVLPFENLSDEKANAYFAAGIQDEILSRLAKIGALKVISRTSTQQYAAKPGNLSEIARQLGVAHILEGSVQKAGDSVHINVQLIHAASDEHLWAESYNRRLDDIFAVEAEVAQTVADALKAKLSSAEADALSARPTTNSAAYDSYLRGLVLANKPGTGLQDPRDAIAALEQAVRLDPGMAPGWARLSFARSYLYTIFDRSAAQKEAARVAMETATRLAPDTTDTALAQGYYHYWVERDFALARKVFEGVEGRLPNASEPRSALALIARREGRWADSAGLFAQALGLDPRNASLIRDAADTAMSMRDYPVAQALVERAIAIAPDDRATLGGQATLLQMRGRFEESQAVLARTTIPADDFRLRALAVSNAEVLHDYPAALALLGAALTDQSRPKEYEGLLLVMQGDVHRLSGNLPGAQKSYRAAVAALEAEVEAGRNYGWTMAFRALAETGLGNREAALAQVRAAMAGTPSSKDAYTGPGNEEIAARVHARFGDKDEAIAILKRLLSISYAAPVTVEAIRVDPDWDKLRDDPRFQALVAGGAS